MTPERAKHIALNLWVNASKVFGSSKASPEGSIETVEAGEWLVTLKCGWTVRLSSHGSILRIANNDA